MNTLEEDMNLSEFTKKTGKIENIEVQIFFDKTLDPKVDIERKGGAICGRFTFDGRACWLRYSIEHNKQVYFTADNQKCEKYKDVEGGLLVNIIAFLKFYQAPKKRRDIISTFLFGEFDFVTVSLASQNFSELLSNADFQSCLKKASASDLAKITEFINVNLGASSIDEKSILEWIKQLSSEQKSSFVSKLEEFSDINLPIDSLENISDEDFAKSFVNFLNDNSKKKIILSHYSQIQIAILEEYKKFLEENLTQGETFIRDWIKGSIDNDGNKLKLSQDEEWKIRRSRCLIFGLEFMDHKREGETGSKRFDVLARCSQDGKEYVLFEMKSPDEDVFKENKKKNDNDGIVVEYELSNGLSRAIPQILNYKHLLENVGNDEEWKKIGLPKGKIAKSIIIIGQNKDDETWKRYFLDLRRSLSSSIEIWTYTDLIEKIDITIKNLRDNLR